MKAENGRPYQLKTSKPNEFFKKDLSEISVYHTSTGAVEIFQKWGDNVQKLVLQPNQYESFKQTLIDSGFQGL